MEDVECAEKRKEGRNGEGRSEQVGRAAATEPPDETRGRPRSGGEEGVETDDPPPRRRWIDEFPSFK